jgi:hypothetical protein
MPGVGIMPEPKADVVLSIMNPYPVFTDGVKGV